MKGIIYCFHCIPTGKKYIGQTVRSLHKRIICHKKDCNKGMDNKFYRAIRKYGWDNFIVGVIDEYEKHYLNEKEMFFIKQYNTYSNGYNSTLGGGGRSGYVLSEETKRKIGEKNKGNKMSEEQKKYLSELYKSRNIIPPSRKGCKMSQDARNKISNARKKQQ